MAIPTCKVTYTLKVETVNRVQELSTIWGVPKSEVIRRIVAKASPYTTEQDRVLTPLAALDRLDKNGITADMAKRYNAEIRRERQAGRRPKK